MPAPRFALFVLFLVCLDFGNPFVGGAFTFESSADGIQPRREPVAQGAPSTQAPRPIRPAPPAPRAWSPESHSRAWHDVAAPTKASGRLHARSNLPASSDEH